MREKKFKSRCFTVKIENVINTLKTCFMIMNIVMEKKNDPHPLTQNIQCSNITHKFYYCCSETFFE